MTGYLGLAPGFEPDIHFGREKGQGSVSPGISGNKSVEEIASELDYDRIFVMVKRDVKKALGLERAGLGLAMSNMPPALGAYWQVGGNYIVMNESLVKAMTKISSSSSEFNSYVYVILMHEYLHSLGYFDEAQARSATAGIVASIFPEDHYAYRMANGDIWRLYPQLMYVKGGNGEDFRVIGQFDSSSTSYIG